MIKRDEYVEKMKHQLDELNAEMDRIAAKANEAKEEARAKYLEEVARLRQQSTAAAAKLESLKASSEDRWEVLMADMDKMRDAFVHSFHYFKSQM